MKKDYTHHDIIFFSICDHINHHKLYRMKVIPKRICSEKIWTRILASKFDHREVVLDDLIKFYANLIYLFQKRKKHGLNRS